MYRVEATGDLESLSNYDFFVMCECRDASGGSLLVDGSAGMCFECVEPAKTESLFAIVYAVAKKIPEDRILANSPPLPLRVIVSRNGELLHDESYEVNQWGGASIYIDV